MPFGIERDRAVGERLGRRRGAVRPPQQRAHARHQLVRAERLREVVVGAQLEADDALGLLGAGGQHDDRDRRGRLVGTKQPADLQAVDVRQHQVEHQQLRRTRRDRLQRLAAGGGALGEETGLVEITSDELGDVRIVLDDQDAR